MRIVFMGSADFGIPALEQLIKKHKIMAVVSTPAKQQGRGLRLNESPISKYALEYGLKPLITPEDLKDSEVVRFLSSLNADLFVVVAFRILPKAIFALPELGTLNIHASLLPKFRGPAPIQRAIEAGEKETGISIFRLDEGIDTGELLMQKKISIGMEETTPELYHRLSILGSDALMEAIQALERGQIVPVKQDEKVASKAPKLKKEEAKIDWTLSSLQIFNKIRAFKPFPGTYTVLNGKRLGIQWARNLDGKNSDRSPGIVLEVGQEYFDVQCGRGFLRVLKVKPEGRKEMKVHEFLLGTTVTAGCLFD